MTDKKEASTAVRTSKKRKPKKKIWVFLLVAFIVASIVAASAFGVIMFSVVDGDFFETLNGMSLKMNSVLYSKNPETGKYEQYEMILSEEDRTWVELEKIPLHTQRAMVAIEDERFYSHNGVDIKRTALAVIKELTGGSSFGGSTITQQLVKNITGDKERSRGRKIREIARAIAAEQKLSKEEILEMYLNTIYLGQNSYGIASAARTYFNKSVSDLTLAESASIVGITQYPALYDPITNPNDNQKRRNIVLDKMCELKFISKQECEDAKNEKLEFVGKFSSNSYDRVTSYFTDQVYNDIVRDLMKEKNYTEAYATHMVENGGLKIYATVDKNIQSVMEKVYMDDNNFTGTLEKGTQSAMVVSDPYTGEVKGIVGGRGKKTAPRVLNRATQSYRQPGSSFKPLGVYAPAIDTGTVVPSTYVDDKPLEVDGWKPKNSNDSFTGGMSVRSAIMQSQNMPAVNILEAVGIEKSYKYVTEKFHISTVIKEDKSHASLALGGLTKGASVMDMNAAYSSFPNGGVYNQPITYTKVVNNKGEVILEKTSEESRAISADAAYIMCDMMKGVVTSGTAAGSQIQGMDTAGKTGTSDLSKDRWFAGFTPYYCGTVWYGYDSPQAVYSGYSNPALNIWKKVMTEIHKGLEPKTFKQPSTLKKVNICSNSGKLASEGCLAVYEYVTSDHKPTSYCSSHNGANIIVGRYNTGEDWETEDEEGEEGAEGEGAEGTEGGGSSESAGDSHTSSSDTHTPSVSTPPVVPGPPPIIG